MDHEQFMNEEKEFIKFAETLNAVSARYENNADF